MRLIFLEWMYEDSFLQPLPMIFSDSALCRCLKEKRASLYHIKRKFYINRPVRLFERAYLFKRSKFYPDSHMKLQFEQRPAEMQ
jgi:hypothetical protein